MTYFTLYEVLARTLIQPVISLFLKKHVDRLWGQVFRGFLGSLSTKMKNNNPNSRVVAIMLQSHPSLGSKHFGNILKLGLFIKPCQTIATVFCRVHKGSGQFTPDLNEEDVAPFVESMNFVFHQCHAVFAVEYIDGKRRVGLWRLPESLYKRICELARKSLLVADLADLKGKSDWLKMEKAYNTVASLSTVSLKSGFPAIHETKLEALVVPVLSSIQEGVKYNGLEASVLAERSRAVGLALEAVQRKFKHSHQALCRKRKLYNSGPRQRGQPQDPKTFLDTQKLVQLRNGFCEGGIQMVDSLNLINISQRPHVSLYLTVVKVNSNGLVVAKSDDRHTSLSIMDSAISSPSRKKDCELKLGVAVNFDIGLMENKIVSAGLQRRRPENNHNPSSIQDQTKFLIDKLIQRGHVFADMKFVEGSFAMGYLRERNVSAKTKVFQPLEKKEEESRFYVLAERGYVGCFIFVLFLFSTWFLFPV